MYCFRVFKYGQTSGPLFIFVLFKQFAEKKFVSTGYKLGSSEL